MFDRDQKLTNVLVGLFVQKSKLLELMMYEKVTNKERKEKKILFPMRKPHSLTVSTQRINRMFFRHRTRAAFIQNHNNSSRLCELRPRNSQVRGRERK